jgi:hypothetical protein
MARVVRLREKDIVWPFEGAPHVKTRPKKAYQRSITVDPFPAYPHDHKLVKETAEYCESVFPIPFPPTYYVLSFDTPAHTNGWAEQTNADWDDEKREYKSREGWIVLCGKRIPPHPAVTRYLVAHEYGHHVEYCLKHMRGLNEGSAEIRNEYAKLRGVKKTVPYGGGNWHASAGELFANDFRIKIMDIEFEYWPHPGFPHADDLKQLDSYWEELTEEFDEYARKA